jgi:hypothetical protein
VRYLLWVIRIAAYMLIVIVMALFMDTIAAIVSQRTDFLPFGWLTRLLREWRDIAFPVLLTAVVGLMGYGLYTTVKVLRMMRSLQQDPPTIDDSPSQPPDHPYVGVLSGHRFQYMGKRSGQLPGGMMHVYDFRAQSGISWVTLTEQQPQGWTHATLTTVFAGHLLETQLYDRKSAPPHDNIEGKQLHRIMLRGNDLEYAYFRHTDAADTLHIDYGKPLVIPSEYAEAIDWLVAHEQPAQRKIGGTILARYFAPVGSYLLLAGFLIYTMMRGWLINTPELPEFITFTMVDERLLPDLWVYAGILLTYFMSGTLVAPSYPIPRRLSLIAYGVAALLALPVMLGLEDRSLLVAATLIGFAAIVIGSTASLARRFVRRREWRMATVKNRDAVGA